MVRVVVEGLLGEVGRQILFFYEAHALTINLLVLTYGLIMLMAWLALTRIYRHLVVLVAKEIHLNTRVNKDSSVKQIRSTIKIPWKEAVNAARFPIISGQTGLFPVRKSVKGVQSMLDEDELITHAIAVLNGENPRKIMPSYSRMLAKKRSTLASTTKRQDRK
jgi:hypothetical protein